MKIGSTKEILKKLVRNEKESVSCIVTVANEDDSILNCVVTYPNTKESLQRMADGIIGRYDDDSMQPHVLIYTVKDCCCSYDDHIMPYLKGLFAKWPDLEVRLDIWAWTQRILAGCTYNKQHRLYTDFVSNLSKCIFDVDKDDYDVLLRSKHHDFVVAGNFPSDARSKSKEL